MAWNVGYEPLYVGDLEFEGQWEVDADSEESAKNRDLIPYLLIGVQGDDQIDWLTSSELRTEGSNEVYTGENDDSDTPIVVELTGDQIMELAHVMDVTSQNVSMDDFLDSPA